MLIKITESQFKKIILREDESIIGKLGKTIGGVTTAANQSLSKNADEWQRDIDGRYLKRYKSNEKSHVKRVQKMLVALGYDVGQHGVDGVYGPDTADGVLKFQKDVFKDPMEWDKIVGPHTYTKLYEEITKEAKFHDKGVEELINSVEEGVVGDEEEVEHHEIEYDDEESDGVYDHEEVDLTIGDKIVKTAEERLGEPYKWGDEFDGKGGDCSGLVDWTFRHVEELDSPGRDTTGSLKREKGFRKGKKNWGETKKGDILLFGRSGRGKNARHTGFVHKRDCNNVDMIHASGSNGVNILKDVFNNNYYRRKYIGYIPYEYFMHHHHTMS